MGLKTGQAGLDLIKQFEGCRLMAYRCPAGILTIGYGHTAGVKAGQTITQAQADKYLVDDVAKYEKNVNKYYEKYRWNQNEFDALVSFAFNIGSIDQLTAGGTRTREQIAAKITAYSKAGGKVLAGLVRRREAEKKLFLTAVTGSVQAAEQFPVLRKGSRGEAVTKLQQALCDRGYTLKRDGIFGSKTLEAVKAFQADNGLVVDGIAGGKTWEKIRSSIVVAKK